MIKSSGLILKFDHNNNYNRNLKQLTLPSCLQNLSFDQNLIQNLEQWIFQSITVDLAIKSSKLDVWLRFEQNLEPVTLPSSLRNLSFELSQKGCFVDPFPAGFLVKICFVDRFLMIFLVKGFWP